MAFRQATNGNMNFLVGLIAGFAVAMLMTTYSLVSLSADRLHIAGVPKAAQQWRLINPRDLASTQEGVVKIHGDTTVNKDSKVVRFRDLHAHHDDDSEAKKLAQQIRVLAWIMTSPKNLDTRAIHVRNTWGKRANTLLFMSSRWNSSFPTIGLNVSEGRQHLTAKTMKAFRYIYENHFNDADWFLKADDDTYVIMENLRYLLSSYSSDDPIYFGHAFKVIVKQGYASGGAGYVMSKEALRRVVTKGSNTSVCKQDGGAEDAEVGKCLMNLGVRLMPSVDRLNRSRFHCFKPENHLEGKYVEWYKSYDAYGAHWGIGNISDYAITFHYIQGIKMYEMEYFIYHLRPYGILSRPQALNLQNQRVPTST